MSVYANCVIFENEQGELGVLTRSEYFRGRDVYWQSEDPNDYSINLDKRIIEFHLQKPNEHTYNEWLNFFEDEEIPVPNFFLDEIEALEEANDYNGSIDKVTGFKLYFVQPGKLWRIEAEPCYDDYHELTGYEQHVAIYDKEDFMET